MHGYYDDDNPWTSLLKLVCYQGVSADISLKKAPCSNVASEGHKMKKTFTMRSNQCQS